MRTLVATALSGLALAAITSAQTINCPLGQPLTSPNQGNPGGGVYLNLTVNTTVTFVNLNYVASDASTAGNSSLNLFVGPSTWVGNVAANPGPWTLVGSTTPVAIPGAVDTPVTGVLNPAGPNPGTITFAPGDYGIALQAVGHSWGYQNGQFTFTSPNNEFVATTGGASNAFLTLPTFSPRSINGSIDFTLGGTPMPFARREPYGAGCYRNFMSLYELFPSSAFVDMTGRSLYWTFNSAENRYSSIILGTTPVNTAIATSASLGHTDDLNISIPLIQPILFPNVGGTAVATSVEMCSNGYVNLLGSTTATKNPTVAAWLTGSAVRMGNHYDMNPAAGGTTHFDYDPVSQANVFSWLSVPTFNIAGSLNTFQMAFFANGDVEMRWGTMSVAGGGAWPTLIGFSPGGASADPGSVDLSAITVPLSTSGVDQAPLALVASANPVLGANVNLTTSNASSLNLGICFVSVADLGPLSPTGLDLGIIGAPGCVANVDINAAVGNLISNLGTPFPGMTVTFPIPLGPPAILGQSFYSQSAWLDALQNAAGIITSNAIRLRVGAF